MRSLILGVEVWRYKFVFLMFFSPNDMDDPGGMVGGTGFKLFCWMSPGCGVACTGLRGCGVGGLDSSDIVFNYEMNYKAKYAYTEAE